MQTATEVGCPASAHDGEIAALAPEVLEIGPGHPYGGKPRLTAGILLGALTMVSLATL